MEPFRQHVLQDHTFHDYSFTPALGSTPPLTLKVLPMLMMCVSFCPPMQIFYVYKIIYITMVKSQMLK
ncbi:hypothetical protein G6F57_008704 [Rhizopus arrhizus]|nr:hypothetical protein G6F41_009401 [Rhizopus arrhizus]KAG1476598.1 hypothetical protein G6F57_008704 [Rhizopus arrhizus]